MSKIYNHNGIAGLVQERLCRASGTRVSVYNASQAALDDTEGVWSTVCEAHGSICNHDTLALAVAHAALPYWCEDCAPEIDKRKQPCPIHT